MCLICADLIRGSLTPAEARRNLSEFSFSDTIDADHAIEVADLIRESDDKHYAEIDPEPFDPFWTNFVD